MKPGVQRGEVNWPSVSGDVKPGVQRGEVNWPSVGTWSLEYSVVLTGWDDGEMWLDKIGWRSHGASSNGMWSAAASCTSCNDPLLLPLPPVNSQPHNKQPVQRLSSSFSLSSDAVAKKMFGDFSVFKIFTSLISRHLWYFKVTNVMGQ